MIIVSDELKGKTLYYKGKKIFLTKEMSITDAKLASEVYSGIRIVEPVKKVGESGNKSSKNKKESK